MPCASTRTCFVSSDTTQSSRPSRRNATCLPSGENRGETLCARPGRERRLLVRREVVEIEVPRAVAVGRVRESTAVWRPRQLRLGGGVGVMRVASPPSAALAAKTSPRAMNASFFPSGETARSLKPCVSDEMLRAASDRRPRTVIGTSLRGAARDVVGPDTEVALERDGLSVGASSSATSRARR